MQYTYFKKMPLVILFILTFYKIILSRYINIIFNKTYTFNVVFTISLYGIFIYFILWNFADDMHKATTKSYLCTYVCMLVFYTAITFYRVVAKLEAKESIYYTLIMLGTFSMARVIERRNPLYKNNILADICTYVALIVGYWIFYLLILKPTITYSFINDNIIAAILLVTIPVIFQNLCHLTFSKKKKIFYFFILTLEVTLVAILGSRAAFFLLLVELFLLAVCNLKKRKEMINVLGVIAASVTSVSILFIVNWGETRYSIYRELSINIVEASDTIDQEVLPNNAVTSIDLDDTIMKESAKEQTKRSDSSRKSLILRSLDQIKENIFFGTGDLFYEDEIAGMGVFNQSAHNCILETLNCYGLIGFFLVLFLLYETLFRKMLRKHTFQKYPETIIIIVVFLAYGMVQPIVYDEVLLPLVITILCAYINVS